MRGCRGSREDGAGHKAGEREGYCKQQRWKWEAYMRASLAARDGCVLIIAQVAS